MITLTPITKALIPRDSAAAREISGKNYDEFQSLQEITNIIMKNPRSILSISMPHCNLKDGVLVGTEGSEAAYSYATELFKKLLKSDDIRILKNILAVYKIAHETDPNYTQIGIIGYGKVSEIRTPDNPKGDIIRNEGIIEKKVQNRLEIIKSIGAYIGIVNNVVDDEQDKLKNSLASYIEKNQFNYMTKDESDFIHTIWIVSEQSAIDNFIAILKEEKYAYVADGNHRSAAAARYNNDNFLCAFFPIKQIHILQYNRLLKVEIPANIIEQIKENFMIEELTDVSEYQPLITHHIGIYFNKKWYKLQPKAALIENKNAVAQLDAEIVQNYIINRIFKINNNEQINFVGGDRDCKYLLDRVNSSDFNCIITLPPVTTHEFVRVCHQNLLMPPKSTWFSPKTRTGLVVAIIKDL